MPLDCRVPCLTVAFICVTVLPYMSSIIAKRKGNKLYYYLVESARVEGKPRIVHQRYLGTAERLASLVQDGAAPIPSSAASRQVGLVGALWVAAQRSGVFELLASLWKQPRSGPTTAHYLLLAALHRICEPGPKTDVAGWYRDSILYPAWGFSPERFTSQAFWDCFDAVHLVEPHEKFDPSDDLDRAQLRLLSLWNSCQMVSSRLLCYDATNFYTFIASTNERTTLAQRGHNKQGRNNLRQVGLSFILDGIHGLSLGHHVYPGNVSDSGEFEVSLGRILQLLDGAQMARDSVTIVFDKGSAALPNTMALDEAHLGWISALPWNQAPTELRDLPIEQLIALPDHPGVHAIARRALVHGNERLCVVKHSASFMAEQIHSLSTSLAKVTQALRRLAHDVAKADYRGSETQIKNKITRWLEPQYLKEVVRYEIKPAKQGWRLQFDIDSAAFNQLMTHRLGRTVLITNRVDWTPEQVVTAYRGQEAIEQVFRGLKDGNWLNWGPMYHWTDSKIRIHAFYCMLGISLLHYLLAEARKTNPLLSLETLQDELRKIEQYVLLYPPQGDKGPHRTAIVQSKQTLTQQLLASTLGLDHLPAM